MSGSKYGYDGNIQLEKWIFIHSLNRNRNQIVIQPIRIFIHSITMVTSYQLLPQHMMSFDIWYHQKYLRMQSKHTLIKHNNNTMYQISKWTLTVRTNEIQNKK